jgi:hypothetical protein
LAIMAIIFGEDEERFYQRSKSVLKPLIKVARNAKIKVAVSGEYLCYGSAPHAWAFDSHFPLPS